MDDMKSTHGYSTGHSSGGSGPEGPKDLGQRASTIQDVFAAASQGEVQIPSREQPKSNDPEKPLESDNSDSFRLTETTSDNKSCQPTVMFGNGSVSSLFICDQAIYDLAPINSPSNFISAAAATFFNENCNFQIANGVLSIRSCLRPCDHFKEVGARVWVSKSVFETNAVPLLKTNTKTMAVQFNGCYIKGEIDRALLAQYMWKHLPNGEILNSALQPQLHCANDDFVSYCSGELLSNCFYFDNSGMYAKLVYWALVIDYQAECGTACAWNKFEGENTITWINLDDENLKPVELTTEFSKGSIMLLQDKDFFSESDYQVLLWLARGGCRVSSEAGANTPDMCYVRWPTINITLLAHGVAPDAWPEATELTSSRILSFASQLARSRSEYYDFCRGIYYAMDLIGVRYASAEGINYRIDSFLSLAQPMLPRPYDYNFFCRLLGIRPPCDVKRRHECQNWLTAQPKMRVHLAALYVAGMQVFTTTFLNSVSRSTANLIQWSTSSEFPSAANRIMSDITSGVNYKGEPLGYSVPKLAFSHYTGFIVEQGLYLDGRGCTWGTSVGGFADAALVYEAFGCQKDLTPRLGSNLAIDDFLVVRPQEWGILGPNTTVFKSNFYSNKNDLGLRSFWEDSGFDQRLCSDRPFLLVPYGIQMLNMFSQFFKKGNAVPQFIAAKYYRGLDARLVRFENDHRTYGTHEYVESLHVYEPCSIRTFDFSSSEIRSPVVLPPNMNQQDAVCVQLWRDQKLPGVGFLLKRDPCGSLLYYYGMDLAIFR